MNTSYFASTLLKQVSLDRQISIARYPSRWWKGKRTYLSLAPTKEMLKMSEGDYNKEYAKILSALDPKSVYSDLGEDAVLLCWEKTGRPCHRRIVAQWLEDELGIIVEELV